MHQSCWEMFPRACPQNSRTPAKVRASKAFRKAYISPCLPSSASTHLFPVKKCMDNRARGIAGTSARIAQPSKKIIFSRASWQELSRSIRLETTSPAPGSVVGWPSPMERIILMSKSYRLISSSQFPPGVWCRSRTALIIMVRNDSRNWVGVALSRSAPKRRTKPNSFSSASWFKDRVVR